VALCFAIDDVRRLTDHRVLMVPRQPKTQGLLQIAIGHPVSTGCGFGWSGGLNEHHGVQQAVPPSRHLVLREASTELQFAYGRLEPIRLDEVRPAWSLKISEEHVDDVPLTDHERPRRAQRLRSR